LSSTPDLLVIGGGPAGLGTAIAAAMSGLSVQVAEPGGMPIDKCCGEGLLPAAVLALGLLGIPAEALLAAGVQMHGIRFRQGRRSASADFASPAVGIRRTALHALLHRRATQLGIEIIAAPARLAPAGSRLEVLIGERAIRPQWIVGADGGQSAVRAAAGLQRGRVRSRRFALRQHFELATGAECSQYVEVYWARRAQAYVTPVGKNRVGVAILANEKLHFMASVLERFPELQARLAGASPCSAARGAVSRHHALARTVQGPIALIGDAGGSVDAITGDGLSLAFLSALALATALITGRLDRYEHAHRRLFYLPGLMSRTLLGMGSHPFATTAAIGLLGHVPYLFSSLLRLHTGVPRRLENPVPEDALWQIARTSTRFTM
jgi:flavin-dependent dehydrogenase